MPHTTKARRSTATHAKRFAKWVANGGREKAKKRLESITDHRVVHNFDDFGRFMANNGEKLRRAVAKRYPGVSHSTLPSLRANGRILVEEIRPVSPAPKIFSPFLLFRFDKVLTPRDRHRLVRCWDELNRLGLKYAHPEANRSITPALHFALWEIFGSKPYITRDTRLQHPKAQPIVHELLGILKRELAPKLSRLLKEFCPEQWERMQRAHRRVKHLMRKQFANQPYLDFEGAFFTVAIKEGSSEIFHLDWNDDKHGGITWIIPLDVWEGGELCLPQLGFKVPIRAGQVVGAQTRRLVHCGSPATGRRVVLTLFADSYLMKHGDES